MISRRPSLRRWFDPHSSLFSALLRGSQRRLQRRKVDYPMAAAIDQLEDRTLLSVDPLFPIVATNVDTSQDINNQRAEVSIDANPANPDNIVAFGHDPFNGMDANVSFDGGLTWNTTPINNTTNPDGITNASNRFDPTVAFDDDGNLFVGYGLIQGGISAAGVGNGVIANVTPGAPITITTGAAHGLVTGRIVQIAEVTGTTGANGIFTITVTGATTFTLNGTNDVTAYGGGGEWEARELVVARSTDGGTTFSSFAVVRDHPNLDKWIVETGRDPVTPTQENVYIGYRVDIPEAGGTDVQIHLAASTDSGATFPVDNIVNDQSIGAGVDFSSFATPSVGPNGELYVIWDDYGNMPASSAILVDVSFDAGVTFGTDVTVEAATAVTRGNANGFTPSGSTRFHIAAQPERGVLTVPSIAVDNSAGPFRGRAYVAYTVATDAANTNDTDVVVRFSDDMGATWSAPKVVHAPSTSSQFLPWLDVDPWSGAIGVVFYDTRNDANDQQALTYIATSTDGAATFSDAQVAQVPSNMSGAATAADYLEYIGIAALNDRFHMIWTDNSGFGGSGNDNDYFYAQAQLTGTDHFEVNNSLASATILGSLPKITLRDLTLDKTSDVDFFKYTATDTGKLIVNMFFENAYGNLDFEILDVNGNVLATGMQDNILPGLDVEKVVIPVVSQEEYWIHVFSEAGDLGIYDLEIENFAAPVPSGIHLDPASDTGMMANDNYTADTTPRFIVQADLRDFADMGITILTPAQANLGQAGAAVEVLITNSTTGDFVQGTATAIGTSNTLFEFTPLMPLVDGVYFVSAAVRITDGQRDANGMIAVGTPANDATQLSEPLWITIDTAVPKGMVEEVFRAELTGDQESPDPPTNGPIVTDAFGNASLVLNAARDQLEMTIELAGLDLGLLTADPNDSLTPDTADDVIGLHIHNGAPGLNGPVVFGLFNPDNDAEGPIVDVANGRLSATWDLAEGNGTTLAAQLANLVSGNLYFNVHTTGNPAGEVRGQILAAGGAVRMLQSSDSGMSVIDNVTNKMSPAFTGWGEANAKVRVFATNIHTGTTSQVGQGVVGSDTTDGVVGNGKGVWEVTVEPLVDGEYEITVEYEDLAGNISSAYSFAHPNLPAFILDDATNDYFLDVAHLFGNITDIDVKLDIEHPDVDQLDIFLIAPDLTQVELVTDVANDGANFTGTSFDDESPISINVGSAPYTGRFNPEGSLSDFDGKDPNGQWILRITDDTDDDEGGLLLGWELCIKTDAGLPIVIDTEEPNTPFLDVVNDSDTGMMIDDNITNDNTPAITVTANDTVDGNGNPFPHDVKYRIYDRPGDGSGEVLLIDSYLTVPGFTEDGFFEHVLTSVLNDPNGLPLEDGVHNLKLEVEDRAGNISHDFLTNLVIDTTAPKAMVEEVYRADLTGGQEVLPVVTTAFGDAMFLLNPAEDRLEMTIELLGLDLDGMQTPFDPSDDVIGLHIHNAPAGANGGVVFGLLGINNDLNGDLIIDDANSRVYSAWDLNEGQGTTLAAQLANLRNGDLYVNVHTIGNPGGEIRGQILAAGGAVRLVPSSDSGMSVIDNVTNKMSPAFTGWGEANSKVRVFAKNLETGSVSLVGQGVVGSDGTDGVLGNGKGFWEVTVEPMVDGAYEITIEHEDLAGNISSAYSFLGDGGPISDDMQPNDFTQDVAHLFGNIMDIDVRIDIEHPEVDQLDIFLIHPDGTQVELVTDVANSGPNFFGTVFDDEAAASINTGVASYKGRFQPEGLLSALDGKDPNGQWTLRITDDTGQEGVGELLGWELCIKTDAGLPIWIDTAVPNTPYLDLVETSDTGRHSADNITSDNTPTVTIVADDTIDGDGNPFWHDIKYRIYDRPGDGSGEVLIVSSYASIPGFSEDGFFTEILGRELNNPNGLPLHDGVHNLKLEVEDRAGNISPDFLLQVVVDTHKPSTFFGLPELAYDGLDHSSDSDVDVDPDTNSDRVTNDTTPTFFGTAEADSIIKVYVVDGNGNQVLIGQTVAVPIDGNQAYPGGRWEVTSALDLNDPSLGFPRDGLRQIEVVGEDVAGNISYGQADVSFFGDAVFNLLPTPGPFDIPDGNSFGIAMTLPDIAGRIIDVDVKLNVWHDNVSDLRATLTHGDTSTTIDLFTAVGGNGDNFIGTVLDDEATVPIGAGAAPFSGAFIPQNPLAAFDGLDAQTTWVLNFFDETVNAIGGSFFATEQAICVKLSPLEIFLDTQGPRVYDPDAGGPDQPIQVITDGVLDTEFNIFDIKPTTGPTPRVDGLKINIEDLPPRFVNPSPEFALAGVVTGATNTSPIVITTMDHGLQTGDLVEVTGVTGNTAANGLFYVKKLDDDTFELVGSSGNGAYGGGGSWATRAFPYRAIANNLALEGHIVITGDRVGNVAFKSITFIPDPDPPLHGESAKGCIKIEFYEPLEDDRFTLTIKDSVVDPANNAFDGESNAQEPFDNPQFPSGDGVAGGNFVARFTVDTRDEIGVFGQAGIFIDANGNYTFNPPIHGGVNFDDVRDLVFDVGIQTDHIFVGEFKAPNQALVNGYDRIGAYGQIGGVFRFLLDIDDDGVVDLNFASNLQINALPVAGNFDGNAANGDEIGLFDGTSWFLDTTGNNVLDTTVTGNLAGLPIVGDFDGDGIEDLGTFDAGIDLFRLSLSSQGGGFTNALTTTTFIFGFPGVNERPAAGQLDADAADDIALTVPDQNGAVGQKEWYILITGDPEDPTAAQFINNLIDPFSPTPVGDDYFTLFGDNQSVPIIGNFDPPTGKDETETPSTMAETAYSLDQSLGLVANSTYNWGGANEKWLGSASGTWYFITEDGKLYKWTGSKPGAEFVSGSQLVATFDANYYADPSMLADAQDPAAGGGEEGGGTVDPLEQAAYDLDQSLGLVANATYNWGGANEKWLGSASGTWYFITEDGSLYKWTGSSPGAGFVSGSQLVAIFDAGYYADLSKLTEAPVPTAGGEEGGGIDPLVQAAYDLDQSLGLVANATYNWGGAKEKWLGSASGVWYFLTEDGSLYKWIGSKPGADFVSGSQLVATFNASFYADPSKLFDAKLTNALDDVFADPDGLLV